MKKLWLKIAIIIPIVAAISGGALLMFFNSKSVSLDETYYEKGQIKSIDKEELLRLENSKSNFALLLGVPGYCSSTVPFDSIVEDFVKKNNLTILSFDFRKKADTKIAETVQYSPSVVIYKNGEIFKFINAMSDDDLPYYQSSENFGEWFNKYVKIRN